MYFVDGDGPPHRFNSALLRFVDNSRRSTNESRIYICLVVYVLGIYLLYLARESDSALVSGDRDGAGRDVLLSNLARVLLAALLEGAAVPGVAAKVPLSVSFDVVAIANVLVNDAVLAGLLERLVDLLDAGDIDAKGVVVDGGLARTAATLRVGTGPGSSAGLATGLDGSSRRDAEEGSLDSDDGRDPVKLVSKVEEEELGEGSYFMMNSW